MLTSNLRSLALARAYFDMPRMRVSGNLFAAMRSLIQITAGTNRPAALPVWRPVVKSALRAMLEVDSGLRANVRLGRAIA